MRLFSEIYTNYTRARIITIDYLYPGHDGQESCRVPDSTFQRQSQHTRNFWGLDNCVGELTYSLEPNARELTSIGRWRYAVSSSAVLCEDMAVSNDLESGMAFLTVLDIESRLGAASPLDCRRHVKSGFITYPVRSGAEPCFLVVLVCLSSIRLVLCQAD
ncbi:hypothetical protein BJX65DRAFT_233966 [Aspergillus insuetus]